MLGVGAVAVFVLSYLSPALKDGGSFGAYDAVVPLTSLGSGLYPLVPHNSLNSDGISQMAAWNAFNWRAIHHLQFPLWNDLTLLGVPHFLNFESATLSLPDLVSYLAPLRFAFLVAIAVKLLIAGTGVYVFCRVLGLRPLSSSFGAVVFMLSGAFASWLTWPLSDVLSWLGWLGALAILAYRWQGRRRYVALLAAATAFSIYGGFPEANVFAVITLALVFGLSVIGVLLKHRSLSARGMVRIAAGLVAGVALAAPLWLPGLQVIAVAHRQTETGFPGDPASALSLLVAPGYFGLPIKGSSWLLAGYNYYETAVYLGVIALVLTGVAVIRWCRLPMVFALAATALAAVALSYQTHSFHLVQNLLNHHGLGAIEFLRMRSVLGLPVGVLAAVGLETMLRARGERYALSAYWFSTALLAAFVGVLWYRASVGIAGAELSLRHDSLIWPIGLVAATIVAGALFVANGQMRHRPAARRLGLAGAAVLAGGEAAFLLFSGVGINSYSHNFYPETPAIARLKAIVGSELVGLDTGNPTRDQAFEGVGFFPEVNLGYEVNEYAGHDPLLPQSYFTTWAAIPGSGKGGPGFFVPDIDSATTARRYGVAWILEAPDPSLGAPAGARYVATVAGERLYAVPGAARFGFVGVAASRDRVTATAHPVASTWTVRVRAPVRAELVVRITDVPGWHATVDGHAVVLGTPDGLMMQVSVAPGTHTIHLWYLPSRFVDGLFIALIVLLAFAVAGILPLVLRGRSVGLATDLGVGFGEALASMDAERS